MADSICGRIAGTLVDLWLWDISVLSHPWMYIPLLIPAMFFIGFVFVKWTVVLCPVWIVPYMVAQGFGRRRARSHSSDAGEIGRQEHG